MKRESKSAPNCTGIILLGLFFFLGGCADTRWPSWLTGEPDASVLNAPRAVAAPENLSERPWPNLADVPDVKPTFSAPAQRTEEIEALASDKLKAQAEMERLRNVPLDRKEAPPAEPDVMKPFSALQP